jgi:hypothetical protein
MTTHVTGFALLLSVVALGAAGYLVLEDRPGTGDLEGRLDALEARLIDIERAVAEAGRTRTEGPRLATTEPREGDADAAGAPGSAAVDAPAGAGVSRPARGVGENPAAGVARPAGDIQELVDAAVEKKAAQIQVMRNKKPHIDVFAKMLELTDVQRLAAEEDIVRSQQQIKEVLEIPTDDGSVFLDEVVEVLARGVAEPQQAQGRLMKLFGRLMAEKVPGSDQTYAVRIEGIKDSLRQTFQRNWTEKQYATFETWQMDPTEVKDVPGSPWKDVERQVIDRAKALGAEIPEEPGPR